jgi:XRE family aerobic/anaerobic benzoate catabolism transcriptional regulator
MKASARGGKADVQKKSARKEALLRGLGLAVRALREGQGWTRENLARRAGLSARFVAQLEAGLGNISVARLDGVARALGSPLAPLLEAIEPEGDELAPLRREVAALAARASAPALRDAVTALQAAAPARPAVIALLGLRGAGKSTVGPLLARRLGVPYTELDDLIQDAAGLNLREMFELHGEGYYRQQEAAALRRLLDQGRPAVLAVSGGIVAHPEAMRLLQERTVTVWLRATPEQHMARVTAQGDRRPMANRPNAMAELRALLQSRAPLYQSARLVLDTGAATPAQCAARLATQVLALGNE